MTDRIGELERKSEKELDKIIDNAKDVFTDVLQILVRELKTRKYRTEDIPTIEGELQNRRRISEVVEKKKYKKTVSYKGVPEFKTERETKLPAKLARQIVRRAILALQWDIVFLDDKQLEAKRVNTWGNESEMVTVSVHGNTIQVSSKSIKYNLCDFGSNSKAVGEFLTAFELLEASFDEKEAEEEVRQIEEQEEKEKYRIPDQLSKPPVMKEKNLAYLLGGGVLVAICLALVLAVLSRFIYVILFFDSLVGLAIAFVLGYLIKLSNISHLKTLSFVGIASICLTYFLSQVFRFELIVMQHHIANASLLEYFSARLNQGLQYKDSNLGMIGLIIAWIIEVTVAILVFKVRILAPLIKFNLERAPEDVVEFAIYWFNEGKDEDGVRLELQRKGWYDKEQQDMILDAIGGMVAIQQTRRSK